MEAAAAGRGSKLDQVLLPAGAQLAGQHRVDPRGRHRGSRVLQPGQVLAVRLRHVLRQHRLEQTQGLAELHRAALELAQHLEQLLCGPLLQLGVHPLGRGTADALAEAEGGTAGEAERQGREPGPAAQAGSRQRVVGVAHLVGHSWGLLRSSGVRADRSPFCARGPTTSAGRIDRPDASLPGPRMGPELHGGRCGLHRTPGEVGQGLRRHQSGRPVGGQRVPVGPGAAELGQHPGPGRIGPRPSQVAAAQAAGPAREDERAHHRTPGPWSYEQVRVAGLGESRR